MPEAGCGTYVTLGIMGRISNQPRSQELRRLTLMKKNAKEEGAPGYNAALLGTDVG